MKPPFVDPARSRGYPWVMIPRFAAAVAFTITALFAGHAAAAGQYPLLHSHNDFNRDHPLFDALAHRFDSVEADVFLDDQGRLLVAHKKEEFDPTRTLEDMYLAPLAELHRRGFLRAGRRTLTLVVQLHQPALETYLALEAALRRHPEMLTVFAQGREPLRGAVTVLLTGSRPPKKVFDEALRFVQLEGVEGDLKSDPAPGLMPIINVKWDDVVKSEGDWPFRKDDMGKLRQIVRRAAAQGRLVRVWGHPDDEDAWLKLLGAGVGVLGTDHLTRLNQFLHR